MSFWKQSALCLIVLVAAIVIWARFFPGSQEILARWGIDWALAATDTTDERTAAQNGTSENGGAPDGRVVVGPITNATINDRLTAIGTGRALNSVIVTPFSSGRITEILVDSGAQVEAGQPIARLDLDAEQIAVDRARLTVDDAQAKLDRVLALRSTNTSTAVQVTDAELELRNAQLALREAELALERRSIVAPISGVVGILPVSEGDYVTTETNIATIDDRSEILIDFWVPERYASSVRLEMPLAATSISRPTEVYQGTVNALDNRIDPESRTLQVQARIINPADTLRAGMAFRVALHFPGDTYASVDPLAVQWGAEGAFVWAVQDGRARRTPVTIIQRNTDSVLVDGDFIDGDVVVVQGIHNVRDGAEVLVAERGGAGSAIPGTAPAPARGS